MLAIILVILTGLWLLGYVIIPGLVVPNVLLFRINAFPITLWDILILIIISWLVGILPRPFREIASVILVLWVLSTVGIFAIAGLPHLLVVLIIVGLLVYIISGA